MFHSATEALPQSLWAEMVNTAAYILNRSSKSSLPDKSPYEICFPLVTLFNSVSMLLTIVAKLSIFIVAGKIV